MIFGREGLNKLREEIMSEDIIKICKVRQQDFTRHRKMGLRDLIYYILNKKGLCTSMETINYFKKIGQETSISAQSLFDQRMKLNPEVFRALNDTYVTMFYSEYPDEVKLFKGHLLKAIDGSDMEVPNTRACTEKYGTAGNHRGSVARAGISCCFDLLNHYITDEIIDKCGAGEIDMAMKHIEKSEKITKSHASIYIMDRNYISISFMTYMMDKGLKFLCRLKSASHYLDETNRMETNDETVIIKHTKHRMQRSRFASEGLFQAAKAKGFTRVRIIKYPLNTGEMEYLVTNIEDFTYDEITQLYNMRWGIETMYHSLKCKLQIEKFTSSVPAIIEQDFLSSVLVYNIVQTTKNEAEEKIDQSSYKHEMKVNENMAIGLLKNELILVMLENNEQKRLELFDKFVDKIAKFKIPIRKGRAFNVTFKPDNICSINKLKAF